MQPISASDAKFAKADKRIDGAIGGFTISGADQHTSAQQTIQKRKGNKNPCYSTRNYVIKFIRRDYATNFIRRIPAVEFTAPFRSSAAFSGDGTGDVALKRYYLFSFSGKYHFIS